MKHIIKIIVITSIILAVGGGLWYYLNGYLTRSKASSENVVVRFSPTPVNVIAGDEVLVNMYVTSTSTNPNSKISGIDFTFINTGSNLEFLYAKSTSALPSGYDNSVLDESSMTAGTSPKQLKRMIIVAMGTSSQLTKSVIIPLYFKVIGQSTPTSTITIDTTKAQVEGPGISYVTSLDTTTPNFTVELIGPAASATNLACDMERNLSAGNCGKATAIKWADVANEEGYKIYRNNQLIKQVGKDSTMYNDLWCENFDPNIYSVIAFNAAGSVATNLPTISCACQVCPTQAPPTPTPIQPTSSADLILRLVFPDAASTTNDIPNVKITVLGDDASHVCEDGLDCEKTVTFHRVPNAQVPNTFKSPQLQYNLRVNRAYAVVVKQNHTVGQTYKHVYLKWQKILQCLDGTQDSGCGQLMQEVAVRPLFSGDLDGSNTIDQKDGDIVNAGVDMHSAEGDLDFDGITDQKDVGIVTKNLNKNGT